MNAVDGHYTTDYVAPCSRCNRDCCQNGWECTAPCQHYTSDDPLFKCEHLLCRRCIEDMAFAIEPRSFVCTHCELDITEWIKLMEKDEDFWKDDCDEDEEEEDDEEELTDDIDSGAETEDEQDDTEDEREKDEEGECEICEVRVPVGQEKYRDYGCLQMMFCKKCYDAEN